MCLFHEMSFTPPVLSFIFTTATLHLFSCTVPDVCSVSLYIFDLLEKGKLSPYPVPREIEMLVNTNPLPRA